MFFRTTRTTKLQTGVKTLIFKHLQCSTEKLQAKSCSIFGHFVVFFWSDHNLGKNYKYYKNLQKVL